MPTRLLKTPKGQELVASIPINDMYGTAEPAVYRLTTPLSMPLPKGTILDIVANYQVVNPERGDWSANMQCVAGIYITAPAGNPKQRLDDPNGENFSPAQHYYVGPEVVQVQLAYDYPPGTTIELRLRVASDHPRLLGRSAEVKKYYGGLSAIIHTP